MPGTNFPTALDTTTTLRTVADATDDVLAIDQNYTRDAVIALETKLGYGADTPTVGKFFVGNTTAGTSLWRVIADADVPNLTGKTYNALTLTAAATGFTIAGGTTSKTLTVALDASVAGTNTGDQDLSGLVTKALYDANTILYATSDDTPVALTIGASTIVGRKATGNIVALTATETRTILNVADGATANTKAAASDVNTGTDDVKYVTSLAIRESYLRQRDRETITTNFTTTDDSGNPVDVTNLECTVVAPAAGTVIRIIFWGSYMVSSAATGTVVNAYIREGSTTLALSSNQGVSGYRLPCFVYYIGVFGAGSHTFKASISQAAAGTATLGAYGTLPAIISAELI